MEYFALEIEQFGKITAPKDVPTGGFSTLNNIIGVSIQAIFIVAILLSLVFLIYGGALWMTSEGNKQTLENARKSLTFSIIGLIIVLLSFLAMNMAAYFFGVPLLSLPK